MRGTSGEQTHKELRKLVFITNGVPRPGLMSGPVHLRILRFLDGHFATICASYADDDVSHLKRFYRIVLRGRWWPPGRIGLHPYLRARRMVRDLSLTSKDHVLVAYPFDGLVLAPLIRQLAGTRFTVIVHDLHADSLTRPEIQAGLAAASSVLCVSDALADAMRPFNSQSGILLPSPGEPMGLTPVFSRKPLALAGGFNDQYLALASKLAMPIIAIGENPGENYPATTFVPRFIENDDAVRFVAENCSAVLVIVPGGHGEYSSHSFPSKLLDFARCGLPMVIIAPPDSPVGRWAIQNNWSLLITAENDEAEFIRVSTALASETEWRAAQREVLRAADGPLNVGKIHAQLLKSIETAIDSIDFHQKSSGPVEELA